MRRFWRSHIFLGILLVLASVLFYWIHYLVFHDAHHIFIYLVGDIAFVFVEVLMVTLIIHQILSEREKRTRLEKLNMVIGSFFSQVGGRLLVLCSDMDPNLATIRQHLLVKGDWSEESFNQARRALRKFEYQIRIRPNYLERLHTLLSDQMDFLLRLLENPVLLEHESFTDLLQAVFHLTEELASREDIQALPESDYHHLGGDVKRVYQRLSLTWLSYMIHLKKHYPYLFSLAMRKNPFDLEASAVVKS